MTVLTALTSLAALLGLAVWLGPFRGPRPFYRPVVWPFFKPVALLLCWAPLHDLAQWTIATFALGDLPTPYDGAAALWFHLHAALLMSWPAALLGVAISVFLRRRPWVALALWAAASVGAALAYPTLRLEPRWWFYAAFSAACCLGAFVLGTVDIARRLREGDIWMAHHIVPMALTVGQASAVLAYANGRPVEEWGAARAAHFIAFGAVVIYETLVLWWNRRGS